MSLNSNEIAMLCVGAVGIVILVYKAYDQTDDMPIPQTQGERQMMGFGNAPGMAVEAGAPLDMSVNTHFWNPDFDDCTEPQPVIQTPHRYPAVPGGNVSTIMHKGFSAFMHDSPSGNDWRITPPEAAVL